LAKEVTRYIKKEVERELWARSAGRCQFDGCNKILYKSSITQETVNLAQKAHIYSFSEDGPRGWGPFFSNKKELNSIDNLMLMCHGCHVKIDHNESRYPADLLQRWKLEHEQRIHIVSEIAVDKKSHVVFYGANIGEQKSLIQKDEAISAMFPNKYPVDEKPILLSMVSALEDKDKEFWQSELKNLETIFTRYIQPRIEEASPADFSLFTFAPMPLLIRLGTLFTDKIHVETYQPIREPKTWRWQEEPDDFEFLILEPSDHSKEPVLVLSLSGKISEDRVYEVTGENINIWEVTVPEIFLHNDFIKSKSQLSMFRKELRKLMVKINEKHSNKPLKIFPAMPISCSVELGRIRMPKSDMQWIIYDQNNKHNKFMKTIVIGEDTND
jgi:hypothetical protein